MDNSSIIRSAENLLSQPYQAGGVNATYHDGLLETITAAITDQSASSLERRQLNEMRDRMLTHKAEGKRPAVWFGSSGQNL
ncbi:hypothetical protein DB032_09455 [Chromobacterium sp. Panama]|nr:hypothetical protein DB032_09455 [Chromobacterium sp. Panama]